MSVMSKTFDYAESCGMRHEFVRRACSFTPMSVKRVGDFYIINETITKQSLIEDIRGGEQEVSLEFPAVGTDCSSVTAKLDKNVEETGAGSGSFNTFDFLIPHEGDSLGQWDIDVYESLNDCGVLMDGGDALQTRSIMGRIVSLCGSIDISDHYPDAYYLDNRLSYSSDVDKYCLVFLIHGIVKTIDLYYLSPDADTSSGLKDSCIDCTEEFNQALSDAGIEISEIISFGMI